MGCDIHILTEVYNERTQTWENADVWVYDTSGCRLNEETPFTQVDWYVGRSYQLFGTIAKGVRGVSYDYSLEPREFPDDASILPDYVLEGSCYHTPSWATLAELQALYHTASNDHNESLADIIEPLRAHIRNYRGITDRFPLKDEHVRIIFWFDN
jgi:hypothetical protein